MTRPVVNELEERRIVRLLAELADEAAPLQAITAAELLRSATAGRPARRRRRSFLPPLPRAAAAAAAAAIAVSGFVSFEVAGSEPSAQRPDSAGALLSFPEGSALRLLLSPSSTNGGS